MNIFKKVWKKLFYKPLIFNSMLYPKPGERTRGGRLYRDDVYDEAIQDYMEVVNKGRAFGQLGYPTGSEAPYEINLTKASHQVTNINKVDGEYNATIQILDTPAGKDLKSIIKKDSSKIGFSMRAVGSMEMSENGTGIAQKDLKIISFDATSQVSPKEK